MATLEELQAQLATLKERYSAVIEGSYSYEESIATIAVNMQAQLDDAQTAASSAGTYATLAENAADEAAVAGAEAGATAGASAAQTKYDDIFTRDHYWDSVQDFYSIQSVNVDADALWARKVDVYSLNADKLALRYSIEDMFYNVSFTSDLHNNGNVKVQLTDSAGRLVWLQCYSADCSRLAAHESITSPAVDTCNLHIKDNTTAVDSVLLTASTSDNLNDIDFVLRFTTDLPGDQHVLLSAYSAGCSYISATDAINAPYVLTKNLILGGHIGNGAEGPIYDGFGVVMQQSYDQGHVHMTLQGKDFSDNSIYDVYLSAYSADFKYLAAENAISIEDVSINKTELQQLKDLASASASTDYYEDSYFENLWAAKRTDDIYVRRIYKFAYNTAPEITPLSDSLPEKVTLTLKTGAIRVYDNALATLFKTTSEGTPQYRSKIAAQTVDACYDPVVEHTLLGFWERCNYYKDENGDTRIAAVRGEEGFDKRKPDVGTFGPAIWFDVRDSLDVDTSGNPMYTEVIVSTSPHPELGLHPHPLAMRHDGTVAPYWCCSSYPASRGLEYYSQPISVYNGYTELSVSGAYSATNLTAEAIVAGCRARGKGYGDGSYIASLLQLMHIIKYGTKDSQSIMKGVCNSSYGDAINVPTASSITEVYSEFDVTKGHYWIPLELNTNNKNFLYKCNAVWVDGISDPDGGHKTGVNKNTRPYMITSVDEYNGILRVWLETDYAIKYSFNTDNNPNQYKITAAKAVAGCTDNVYSKYDGPAMHSACFIAGSNAAANGYQPFRLHGIEYGLQWETFMDKVWETPSSAVEMTENGTQCYYRLPWEYKYTDTTSSPVHATTERYVSGSYGTDYSTKVIASNYADSGYDVAISVPVCVSTAGSSSTGLCDYYGTPSAGGDLQTAGGWGYPDSGSGAGLFYYGCDGLVGGYWYSGARL